MLHPSGKEIHKNVRMAKILYRNMKYLIVVFKNGREENNRQAVGFSFDDPITAPAVHYFQQFSIETSLAAFHVRGEPPNAYDFMSFLKVSPKHTLFWEANFPVFKKPQKKALRLHKIF